MEQWLHGPIIYFNELNRQERYILGHPNKLIRLAMPFDGENWFILLNLAERVHASWFYLPDVEPLVIDAMNKVFSHFNLNVRVRGQIMSEHSKSPVGVQY